ncbi:MAG TPA: ATP-binding protein [Candidatus Obscuribacterales bacterium]
MTDQASAAATSTLEKTLSVLVVEDSATHLRAIRAILHGKGFDVQSAMTLEEALNRLEKRDIDVVLLDLSLPDSRGIDTLKAIYSAVPMVPIIVLTSTEDEQVVSEALQEGAQDYLIKGQLDSHLLIRSIRYSMERVKSQEALRESEERMRVLIEGVQDYAIFLLDRDGRVVTWNSGAEKITGYSAEEIIGKHLSHFYTPADVQKGTPDLGLHQAVLRGRYEEEGWRLRKDGSRFWANVVNTPLYDTQGRLRGFARVARDMTEQRAAEETLRQKIALQQKTDLVEVLQAVTVSINRAGSIEDAVSTCLKAISSRTRWTIGCGNIVTGEAHAECLVTKVWYFQDEKSVHADDSVLQERLVSGVGLAGQAWASGKPVWIGDLSSEPSAVNQWLCEHKGIKSGLAIPVWEGTKLLAIMELFSPENEKPDQPFFELMANIGKQLSVVIERKELEQMLISQMQELAHSNAELQEFAKVAAHDLQEPLRSVRGFVELLMRRYKGQLDEDADRFLGFIYDAVQRMEQLIQGVLEHSRIRTEGRPFQKIDLNEVFKEVVSNLQVAIDQTNASVTSDELPTVVADPLQMVQLMQNLVSNGIKFRFADKPPIIHISARRQEGDWVFSVRDNGLGIEERYLKKIFGMFSRLHSKADYPGTGIGLAICKKIVEYHGGTIWVHSELGKGSTFCFTLPADR